MPTENRFFSRVESKPECIIASNRGPVEYQNATAQLGSGGLVTALLGAAQRRRMVWISLSMTSADRQRAALKLQLSDVLPATLSHVKLQLLDIPEEVYRQYYYHISNRILWFAQHALLDAAVGTTFTQETHADWEQGYSAANQAIASAIIDNLGTVGSDTPVIIQDYQLYLVAGLVRERYPEARLGHVIYIPWPDARYLAMLPDYMTHSIYQSLAANDLIGFQTESDARNFLVGVSRFLPDARVQWHNDKQRPGTIHWRGRSVKVTLQPAMLSVEYLRGVMQSHEAAEAHLDLAELLKQNGEGQLIVRVDRVEPTKNIIRGFQAYERLLYAHPELHGKLTFLALLVPSREQLDSYRNYEQEVKELIEKINACYSRQGWQPIRAIYGNNRVRGLAGLQAYDVLLVNPVVDGMNLVVKEGALLNKGSGVIVLSQTVGVHDTVGEHVLSIAPLDVEATAEALYRALTLSPQERQARATALRGIVEAEDVTAWFSQQLAELRPSG